jgi:hypothetical protein
MGVNLGGLINQSEQHSFFGIIPQGLFGFKKGVVNSHQVFGFWCLVFRVWYLALSFRILNHHVRTQNTKHKIQNAPVKKQL